MNILHVLKHGRLNNGHVHVAVDLACTQADAGHNVAFASGPGSFDDLLRSHGVHVVHLRGTEDKRSSLLTAVDLYRATRRHRPDIIHAHMMSSAVLAFPITKFSHATLVTTMHNSFDGHSTLMRLGKIVVAVSEAERRALIERGFKSRKVVAVLNGAADSPRGALPIDQTAAQQIPQPCVLSLSGLHPRKAVSDIILAFSLVLPDFPDWHLNIVGGGPGEQELRDQVIELDISESVHFLGSTMTPLPLLQQADIFASASLADPCPLTTTEARAAGCAIVATAVGGVPEVLDHGRAGQLVPRSSPLAMAQIFRSLMSDKVELNRWRQSARLGADHFTVRRVAGEYERVYRSVVR